MLNEDDHIRSLHEAQQEALQHSFVARKITRASFQKRLLDVTSGLLVVSGKSGCGKSALLVSVTRTVQEAFIKFY